MRKRAGPGLAGIHSATVVLAAIVLSLPGHAVALAPDPDPFQDCLDRGVLTDERCAEIYGENAPASSDAESEATSSASTTSDPTDDLYKGCLDRDALTDAECDEIYPQSAAEASSAEDADEDSMATEIGIAVGIGVLVLAAMAALYFRARRKDGPAKAAAPAPAKPAAAAAKAQAAPAPPERKPDPTPAPAPPPAVPAPSPPASSPAESPPTPAGWLADPEQPQTWRYWDGTRWTDQRAPMLPSGVSGRRAMSIPSEVLWAGGSAAAMIVGAIGPWVNAGFISAGGLNGDGVIVLVAGIAAFAAVVGSINRRSGFGGLATLVLLAGLVGAGTSIYDIVNILGTETRLFGEDVQIGTPGWGLWLSAAASVTLTVAGACIFRIREAT